MAENEKKRTPGKMKPVEDMTPEERRELTADRFLWRPEEIVFTYVPGKTPKDKKK